MQFNVVASSSWAPGLPSGLDWLAWQQGRQLPEGSDPPDLSHIKPMQRRRLSLSARAAFAVGYECLQKATVASEVVCVFSNAYGPTPMTANMLENIARAEPISPTSFSISVHNAIAGQFSIAHGITAPSSTIAPGRDGVGGAFIEAMGWLNKNDATEVLLCFYEEPLDPRLKPFEEQLPTPMATGILIASEHSEAGHNVDLSREIDVCSTAQNIPHWRQILSLGAFLAGEDETLTLRSGGVSYRWQKQR